MTRQESIEMILDEILRAAVDSMQGGMYRMTWAKEQAEADVHEKYIAALTGKGTITAFFKACNEWVKLAQADIGRQPVGITT